MKPAALILAAAIVLAPSAPSFAGVQIRQYQEQGIPTPYPNAVGDSQVTPSTPPPSTEQLVPDQVVPRNSPPIRVNPY